MKPDTKAIQARADAATAGDWTWDREDTQDNANPRPTVRDAEGRLVGRIGPGGEWSKTAGDNARFIAAARADVPALCARVEALEDTLRRLKLYLDMAREVKITGADTMAALVDAALEGE